MKSKKDIVRERIEKEAGRLTQEGEEWSGEEIACAVRLYLHGYGFRTIGKKLKRTETSVQNVVKSDIPRNYRDCIRKAAIPLIPCGREGSLSDREKTYLAILREQGRTEQEIILIMGRPKKELVCEPPT